MNSLNNNASSGPVNNRFQPTKATNAMNFLNNNASSGPANNRFQPTKATKVDAESGLNNDRWMTPLRTAQAIAAMNPRSTFISPTPPSATTQGSIWVNSENYRPHVLQDGIWAEFSTN